MSLSVEIFNSVDALSDLAPQWESLLAADEQGITGASVSNTLEWHACLAAQPRWRDTVRMFVVMEADVPVAIFPAAINRDSRPKCIPNLLYMQEIYATRSGLITARQDPLVIDALVAALDRHGGYGKLYITLIEGSRDETQFFAAAARYKLAYRQLSRVESAYIDLSDALDRGDCYFDGLDRKFRYNVNSRETKLAELGTLTLTIHEREDEVRTYLDAVYAIESSSWKENSGTSITTNPFQRSFYEAFTPRAAARGWLRGAVLRLNGVPVAYSYGIAYHGVFESLKSSYDDNYKKFAPGNVIKKRLLEYVTSAGLRYYDLMGEVEESKLKWNPRPYVRSSYVLFPRTVRGNAMRFSSWLQARRKAQATAMPDAAAESRSWSLSALPC